MSTPTTDPYYVDTGLDWTDSSEKTVTVPTGVYGVTFKAVNLPIKFRTESDDDDSDGKYVTIDAGASLEITNDNLPGAALYFYGNDGARLEIVYQTKKDSWR